MSAHKIPGQPSSSLSRRRFLQHAGTAAVAAGLATSLGDVAGALAATDSDRAKLGPPNAGQPITLTVWNPYTGPVDVNLYTKWFNAYQKAYPNVTIKLQTLPWAVHWTKLQAAAQSGTGPDIDLMHHALLSEYYEAGILAPYPETMFPQQQIQAEYDTRGQFAADGRMYLFPLAIVTGMVYYNQDIWTAAGLSTQDYPKTWDDLGRLAQQLTIRKNGVVQQWGFNFHDDDLWVAVDMYYQMGQYLFSADGHKAIFNNAAMAKAIALTDGFTTNYKVSSFTGTDWNTLFVAGKNAMTWGFPWVPPADAAANPKLRMGAFPLPRLTPGTSGIYGRGDVAARFGVLNTSSAAKQATAFHFLHWLFMTGNRVQTALDYANLEGGLPSYKAAQPTAQGVGMDIIKEVKSSAVFAGDLPAAFSNALTKAFQQIQLTGTATDVALAGAVQASNRDLMVHKYLFTERQRA